MAKFGEYNIKLENSDEKGMLNVNALLKYLPKGKKAICEIKLPNGFGSGFFCKIPFTENNNIFLPVLITNDHVLPRDLLNNIESIEINFDGESKAITLKQRKIWNNKKMDFTCIEIKEEEDKIHTFFNLDDSELDKNGSNEEYLKMKVLIFGINKNDKEVGISNEIIKKNDHCFFAYTCNTFPGCSGGCIVNQLNNCVIGIHRGEITIENEKKQDSKEKKNVANVGIYIRNVIECIKYSKESLLSYVNNFLYIFI